MLTETATDLATRLHECRTTAQMTRLVKHMIAEDPTNGVARILGTFWTLDDKEARRLERLWLNWLKA